MKILICLMAFLAVPLCGFTRSAFDPDGFAYNISDEDRRNVEKVLEYSNEEISKRIESGETFGHGFINPEGEMVYRKSYNDN